MELVGASGLITGASRGLGRLIALALAERGADLVLAARNKADLEETRRAVAERDVRAIAVPCDVTRKEDLENLVEVTVRELGPPNLLINNAGIETVQRFDSMSLHEIEQVLVTNTLSAMWLTRLVIPHMIERKRGHVVNISSHAGKIGMPFFVSYASSKHALVGFSWSLREELRPHGIGVSVVCPSFISDTGMAGGWVHRSRPALSPDVPPDKVVKAVLRAIERNKADTIVAKGAGPLADVCFAISPDISSRVIRASGVHDYFAKEADSRTSR